MNESYENLLAALRERVQAGNDAIARGDAEGWNRAMYAENVIVAGEGMETIVRGQTANFELVKVLLDSGMMQDRQIEIAFADGSGDFAYTFVNFRHTTDPNDNGARALYVWHRMDEGWRVVADMYGNGAFR